MGTAKSGSLLKAYGYANIRGKCAAGIYWLGKLGVSFNKNHSPLNTYLQVIFKFSITLINSRLSLDYVINCA